MSANPWHAALLVGAWLIAGAACAASAQSMSPPQREALSAAERWLERVDAGRYADAWAMASEPFKATVGKQQWSDGVRKLRKDYGRVVTRKGDRMAFVGAAPNPDDPSSLGKPGLQIAIIFETKFAGNKLASEQTTLVLEPDGLWRVSGYYIK